MNWKTAVAALTLGIMVCGQGWAEGPKTPAKGCASLKDICDLETPADSPIALAATAGSASLKDGIRLSVVLTNQGDKPYALSLCPNMQMCSVRGLHPMLAFDDTGMGLLDICTNKAACEAPKEITLAPKATHAVDLTIPADRIPKAARAKDKEISVFFCFELADGRLCHSSVATVTLTE